MRLAILSTAPSCYSTRRLRQAAVQRGHTPKVRDTLRFAIELEHGEPSLWYRSKPMRRVDAILPRIGASVTYFGTAVVRQFEQMDVYTPNTSNGIANARDKLRSLQILSRHDIGIPHTTFVRDREDVLPAIERLGGAPIIIKILEGTQGVGVILAESTKVAEAIIETLQSARQNVLVQRFIRESRGTDLRAIVVGDRVVAAMRRTAQGEEFRSNVHRGGKAEAVQLEPAFETTAAVSYASGSSSGTMRVSAGTSWCSIRTRCSCGSNPDRKLTTDGDVAASAEYARSYTADASGGNHRSSDGVVGRA